MAAAAAASRTVRIVGISGSLRKHGVNGNLLKSIAAKSSAGDVAGVDFSIVDIGKLPLYNSDLEGQKDGAIAFPAEVEEVRAALSAADAFIFACPEYNYSISPALKNAIDWGSRTPNVFNDKAGGIVGAGGLMGTTRAQYHLRQVGVFLNLHFISKPEGAFFIWEPSSVDLASGKNEILSEAWHTKLSEVAEAVRDHSRRLTAGKAALEEAEAR